MKRPNLLSEFRMALFFGLLLIASTATAAVPGLISYQGRLTTASGDPVSDGAYFVRFQIYDAPVGGTSLWNSNIQPVQTKDGVYTYVLGQDVPFPNGLFSGGNRWLGVTVGVDPELSPRQQFLAAPFTFVSQNADSVNWSGIKNLPAGFADGVDDNSGDITAINTSGGLTGGATSGDANLSIANGGVTSSHIADGQIGDADLNAAANIASTKINGTAATLSGANTFVNSNVFDLSLRISDSTFRADGNGIFIGRDAAPGIGYLLQARRNYNTATTKYGLYTRIENVGTGPLYGSYSAAFATTVGDAGAGITYGTYSYSESDNISRYGSYSAAYANDRAITSGESFGAYGYAGDGFTAYGVYGYAASAETGRGVQGYATGNSVGSTGVFAEAENDPTLRGVYGTAHNGSTGWGVWGAASNNSTGYGVYGEASGNTTNYAVYGFTTCCNLANHWAGYFYGNVNVTGTLYTPVFVQRIDHPLDPENQGLQLSGMVSPEMTNVLSGNATTDQSGEALVNLPEYFTAMSTDYRYQLTVIGQFAQAIVAREIENNRFLITSDKPNVKVSWQVTALRNDSFAKTNRTQVEFVKSSEQLGRYFQPQAFGLGSESGVEHPMHQHLKEVKAADAAQKSASSAPESPE